MPLLGLNVIRKFTKVIKSVIDLPTLYGIEASPEMYQCSFGQPIAEFRSMDYILNICTPVLCQVMMPGSMPWRSCIFFFQINSSLKIDFTDPCVEGNHEGRYEEVYRSTRFIITDESERKCDKDLPRNWYRFVSKAGNDMPNHAPNVTGACGTTSAVWLRGKFFA